MLFSNRHEAKIAAWLIGLGILLASWYESRRRKLKLQSLRGTWDSHTEKVTISTFQHRRRIFLRAIPLIIGLFFVAVLSFEHSPQQLPGQPIPSIAAASIIAFLVAWSMPCGWPSFTTDALSVKVPQCSLGDGLISIQIDAKAAESLYVKSK